ncbi:MAG: glutathione S-transferase [Rhodospirillaceae bacterium]|nr:glutathione S-transferase [Rhodospirillaceae bacterium]|tara:strand:+ start:11828 stop:12181 length:354 start_codon:yes stop_codon:yes gene_type:complete
MAEPIYHMCRAEEWETAQKTGEYTGSSQDRADGFIHFSTRPQIVESAKKHRAGQTGLILLTVDPTQLGESLKWEESRGGALFPHLYGNLPVEAVQRFDALPLGEDGEHIFPAHITET